MLKDTKDASEQFSLMKAGKSFHFDDYLFSKQKECSEILCYVNKLPFGDKRRDSAFKKLFKSIGSDCIVKEGFHCNFGFNVSIGDNCYINYSVTILDSFEVSIGNNVFIAPNVVISAVTHPLEADQRRNLLGGKTIIEDDVWIGANATILPGITIKKGAVIGAGAVVTKDVEENTVVGGVPACFIKTITQ